MSPARSTVGLSASASVGALRIGPPSAGATKPRHNPPNTELRRHYERSDLPVIIDSSGVKAKLRWLSPWDALDFGHLLPIFFDGLREEEYPYRMIADGGIRDLLAHGGAKILPVIPLLIVPLRNALNTRIPTVIIRTIDVLKLMVLCDLTPAMAAASMAATGGTGMSLSSGVGATFTAGAIAALLGTAAGGASASSTASAAASASTGGAGASLAGSGAVGVPAATPGAIARALVPYYRQLFPILSIYLMSNVSSGDKTHYGQRKNDVLGDRIQELLNLMEMHGGPDAYVNIKYLIPTYQSCMGRK